MTLKIAKNQNDYKADLTRFFYGRETTPEHDYHRTH
jgi:hypothetical protein